MRIDFFWEFPGGFDEEKIRNEDYSIKSARYQYQALPVLLFRKFVKMYPNVEFRAINVRDIYAGCCCSKYNIAIPLIMNPDTGKYMAISWCDKNMWIRGDIPLMVPNEDFKGYTGGHGWDLENCVDVFTVSGLHLDDVTYKPAELQFTPTPSVLPTLFVETAYEIERIMENPPTDRVIPEKLWLRGRGIWPGLFRHYLMLNDERFKIYDTPIAPIDFVRDLSKYSIMCDINGGAEISQRTIDGCGLGIAVIRPKLLAQYHNKLIPDYHYAAVRCDDLSDYPRLADAYIERFEELKKNPDYVKFLSENARKWYVETSSMDSYVRIFTEELIDLNKLK